jgi:hypothetical protein
MKTLSAPLAFIAAVIMAGCQTPVYDADVQFEERLVIEGILAPGAQVAGIYIGKTLSVKAVFDPKEAEVHDAVANVVVDGIDYPLHHVGSGLYEAQGLVAQSGKVYALTVEWNGLRATAQTLVPYAPDTASLVISPVSLTYNIFHEASFALDASFLPEPGETYGVVWTHDEFDYGYYPDSTLTYHVYPYTSSHLPLVRNIDVQSDGRIHIAMSGNLYGNYIPEIDTLFVAISAFDEQFYDYYNSNGKTTSFEDLVLGMSPGAVKWNVSGNGIGMFIGKVSIKRYALFRWNQTVASMDSRGKE